MATEIHEIINEVLEIMKGTIDIQVFNGNLRKLKIYIDYLLPNMEAKKPGQKQQHLLALFQTAKRDKQWEMATVVLKSDILLTQVNSNKSLLLAVENGEAPMVEILIKKHKADPNICLPLGETLLMNAIANCTNKIKEMQKSLSSRESKEDQEKIEKERKKFIATILKLIQCGADINKRHDNLNSTSLYYAIVYEEYTIAQLLIAKNADVNASFKNPEGAIDTPFKKAVDLQNFPLIKLLINSGRLIIDPHSKEATSALILAIENRNPDIVKFLLEKGVFQNGEGVIENPAPLMMATMIADIEIVKLLLQYGANVNEKVDNSLTALHIASEYGHAECVKLLLANGAREEIEEDTGNTPLLYAAQNGHASVIEAFFDARKKVNLEVQNSNNLTALMLATRFGHEDCVKLLVENGAKIEGSWFEEMTPLMFAAKHGHIKILEYLIQKGADLYKKSKIGYTAFDYACLHEQIPCVQFLLKKNFTIEDIHAEVLLSSAVVLKSEELDQILMPMWGKLPFNVQTCKFLMNCRENNLVLVKRYLDANDVNKEVELLSIAEEAPIFLWTNQSSKEIKFLVIKNKYHHAYSSIDQNHVTRFIDCLFEVIDDFKFANDAALCINLTKDNKKHDISISEGTIIELINKPEVQAILRIADKEDRNRQFRDIIWGYSNEAKELKEEQEINDLKSEIVNFLYQSISEIEINSKTIIDLLKRIELENLNIDSKDFLKFQADSKTIAEKLKSQFELLKKEVIWNEKGFHIKEKLKIELEKLHAIFKECQDENSAKQISELKQKIVAAQEEKAKLNTGKAAKGLDSRSRKKRERKREEEETLLAKREMNSFIRQVLREEESSKDIDERKRKQEGESQSPPLLLSLDSSPNIKEIILRDDTTLVALELENTKLKNQSSQVTCKRTPFQPPNINELISTSDNSFGDESEVSRYLKKPEHTLDSVLGLSAHLESKEAREKLIADLKKTPEAKTEIEALILCEALEGRFAIVLDKQNLQEDWPYHIRLVLFKNERGIYQNYSKIQVINFFKEIIEKLEKISPNDLMKMGHKLSLQSIDTQEGFLKGLMHFNTSNTDLKIAIEMIDLAKNNLKCIEEYIISNLKSTDNIHLIDAVGRNFGRIGTYLHQIRGIDPNTFWRINRSLGFTIPIAAQYRHDEVVWKKEAEAWIANAKAKQKVQASQGDAFVLDSKPRDKEAHQTLTLHYDATTRSQPKADAGDTKSAQKKKQGNKRKKKK